MAQLIAFVLGNFTLTFFVVGLVAAWVRSRNFAPGNAGVIFWTDILLPVFGLALVGATRPRGGVP